MQLFKPLNVSVSERRNAALQTQLCSGREVVQDSDLQKTTRLSADAAVQASECFRK